MAKAGFISDQTIKFANVALQEKANKMVVAQFLRDLIARVPYALQTILTDNGIPLTHRTSDHLFDRVCAEYGIKHRLTKVKRP